IIIQKFKSEKLLKESEEKFRTLSEQSMMGIGILQDYELKYANNRLASILGLVKEEMKGIDFQGLLQMIHPEDREKVIKQVQRRKDRTQDTITFYHFRAFKKTGELVWVEVYSRIINYQGERASLLTFLDITDMKMAELKLKESEEKFRTLFEKANDGILLADNETGQIFTGNTKICEMLGYTLEELKNKSFGDLHPKENLSYIDEQFEEEQSEIGPDVNDIPMKRKDGSIFYCNVNSSKIELAGTSYFMGIFRDITERKNAEQKLKESEEKFRNIAEQSFMGIIIIQRGVLMYMNKAMSKISGYSIEEMLTWPPKEMVQMIHPEDVKIILKRLQSNIDSNMGPFSSNAFRIINKNGEVRWLEDYTTRIIYQGEQANLISVIDITDR
ncbi:MAG: PAS domain S-box protein, partial [Candidatus Lokiarchaeota archaeon]|nr:PAS domain S-box protein [Candidatus Lokiarchaeota archaeon]